MCKNVDGQIASRLRRNFDELSDWARDLVLSSKTVDDAIVFARFFGELKSSNFDGTYFDDDVERVVEEAYLRQHPRTEDLERRIGQGVLVMGTELYDFGGHTPAMLKWLHAKALGLPHRLVVTRTVSERNRAVLDADGADYHVCSHYSSHAITELLEYASGTDTVVLHIHSNDIVAAVAARILKRAGWKLVFYNHADQLFSFGIKSAHLVAEIGSFGECISERSGRATDSCWVGIPVAIPENAPAGHPSNGRRPELILACGSAYKFKPADGLFFGDLIDGVLASNNRARFRLVGPTGRERWWEPVKKRWGSRVEFLGSLPRSAYFCALLDADVFVDGFPLGGGTSFVEAILLGKQCAGLALPFVGCGPTDGLRVQTIHDLATKVLTLLEGSEESKHQAAAVREEVQATLGVDAFKRRIEAVYRGQHRNACVNPFQRATVSQSCWYEHEWERKAVIHVPSSGALRQLPYRLRCILAWKLMRTMCVPAEDLALTLVAGMKKAV